MGLPSAAHGPESKIACTSVRRRTSRSSHPSAASLLDGNPAHVGPSRGFQKTSDPPRDSFVAPAGQQELGRRMAGMSLR